jgi:hypothetical protein
MPDPHLVKHYRFVDLDSVLKYDTVMSWYSSRIGDGRKTAIYHFAAYHRWRASKGLPNDPDAWISECVEGTNRTLIEHLKALKLWIEGDDFEGRDYDTRSKYYTDIRSFYSHHLVPLPKSKLNVKREDETKVETEVTATEFLKLTQKVLERGQVRTRDRSIILSMLQGGMDASTLAKSFNYLAFPQLVRHFGAEDWSRWNEKDVPVRVALIRPKTNYRYYTFQDRDAIAALKDWLNARKSLHGAIKIKQSANPKLLDTSDPIYLTDFGGPLRAHYVTNLFEFYGARSGVNVTPEETVPRWKGSIRRYPWHSHEVRDTLVTLGRRAQIDMAVANFFVGHDIDEYGYDKSPWDDPEYFRNEYSKVSPYLNIITNKEQMIKEQIERGMSDRLRSLEEENRRQQETIALLLKHAGLSAELAKHSP